MSDREAWMPTAIAIKTAMAGGWPSVEREIRAAVAQAMAEERASLGMLISCPLCGCDLSDSIAHRQIDHLIECRDRERARHAREWTEFIGSALHEFGVSGDDAQTGELPGNLLLRLIRERDALHAREVEKAREALEIAIEYARHGEGCSAAFGENYRCRCGWNESKVEIEAALAALEEK